MNGGLLLRRATMQFQYLGVQLTLLLTNINAIMSEKYISHVVAGHSHFKKICTVYIPVYTHKLKQKLTSTWRGHQQSTKFNKKRFTTGVEQKTNSKIFSIYFQMYTEQKH